MRNLIIPLIATVIFSLTSCMPKAEIKLINKGIVVNVNGYHLNAFEEGDTVYLEGGNIAGIWEIDPDIHHKKDTIYTRYSADSSRLYVYNYAVGVILKKL